MESIAEEAEQLYRRVSSWVVFHRLVFGVDGLIAQRFDPGAERARFYESDDYAELCEMLADLRSSDTRKPSIEEPEQMITIRIPKSLHAVLIAEAGECDLSINKLAITKLLKPADPRTTPEQLGRVRGRRPGRG